MPGQMPSFPVPAPRGPPLPPPPGRGCGRATLSLGRSSLPVRPPPHLLSCPTPGLGRSFVHPPSLVSFLSFLFLMGCVLLGMFLFLIFLPFLLAPLHPSSLFSLCSLPTPGSCSFSPPPSPLLQRTCWRFKGYSVASRPRSLTVAGDYKKAGQARGAGGDIGL